MKRKNIFRLFILLSILLYYSPDQLNGQPIPKAIIFGKVISDDTKEPIPYANVFLSNSTLGDATDKNGNYKIEQVPFGTYELVVSVIGYELETKTIRLDSSSDREIHFKLRQKVLEGEEISIYAPYPEEWKHHLKRFTKYFLGTSQNARKCEILNKEILNFNYQVGRSELSADADQPLEIENKALGYRLVVNLISFTFRSHNDGRYVCKPRFELLTPTNEKQNIRWEKNRRKAYRGSFRHFMVSLFSGNLWEEGFLVYNTPDFLKNDKRLHLFRINANDVLFPAKNSFEKKLSFKKYLNVFYMHEEKAEECIGYSQDKKPGQRSWIRLSQDTVIVNQLGYVKNPYAIKKFGYWAWERMAELLPLDYKPTDESNK